MDRRSIVCDIQDTLALVSSELSQRVANVYVSSTQGALFETVYKIISTSINRSFMALIVCMLILYMSIFGMVRMMW